MASVAPLGSDVWDPISRFLEPLDVLSLWMTGSSVMRQKIGGGGGVKALRFDVTSYMPAWTNWPRFWLEQLKGLTVFHLTPLNPQCLLPKLKPGSVGLDVLPRGLTDLELGYVEAIYDDLLPHLPPHLTRLWLPYNTQISHDGLQMLPKSLFSLNLKRNQVITDASKLPSSLTHFVGNACVLLPSDDTFPNLPPHISKLRLVDPEKKIQTISNALADVLPDYAPLSHLCLTIPSGSDLLSILRYPPNLLELKLYGDGCAIPYHALSRLPLSLRRLSMRPDFSCHLNWTDEHVALLPANLLHLEFLARNTQISTDCTTLLTTQCFEKLPTTLTVFRVPFVLPPPEWTPGPGALQAAMDESLTTLPSTLTSLRVCVRAQGRTAEPEALHALPPLLTDVYTLRVRVDERSNPMVPKGLSLLSLSGARPLPIPGALYIYPRDILQPDFPVDWALNCGLLQSARYLHLSYSRDLRFLHSLSPNLVYLDLVASALQDQHIRLLPDTLTFFRLGDPNELLTDACLPSLPRHLRTLRLPTCKNISASRGGFPHRLHTLELGPYQGRNYAPKFPRFLTSLELNSPAVTDKTLSHLPQSLTLLSVMGSTSVTGAIVPLLPSELLILKVPNLDIKNQDVSQLPRGLRQFSCIAGCTRLTDTSMGDWPPLLNTLRFPGASISLKGLALLPRSLDVLELIEAPFSNQDHNALLSVFGTRLTNRFRIGRHSS